MEGLSDGQVPNDIAKTARITGLLEGAPTCPLQVASFYNLRIARFTLQ